MIHRISVKDYLIEVLRVIVPPHKMKSGEEVFVFTGSIYQPLYSIAADARPPHQSDFSVRLTEIRVLVPGVHDPDKLGNFVNQLCRAVLFSFVQIRSAQLPTMAAALEEAYRDFDLTEKLDQSAPAGNTIRRLLNRADIARQKAFEEALRAPSIFNPKNQNLI